MIGYKLYKREDLVSEEEFTRKRSMVRLGMLVWAILLLVAIFTMASLGWYLVGVIAVFVLLMPSPGETVHSYEYYKKTWLRIGGSARGDRAAKI